MNAFKNLKEQLNTTWIGYVDLSGNWNIFFFQKKTPMIATCSHWKVIIPEDTGIPTHLFVRKFCAAVQFFWSLWRSFNTDFTLVEIPFVSSSVRSLAAFMSSMPVGDLTFRTITWAQRDLFKRLSCMRLQIEFSVNTAGFFMNRNFKPFRELQGIGSSFPIIRFRMVEMHQIVICFLYLRWNTRRGTGTIRTFLRPGALIRV